MSSDKLSRLATTEELRLEIASSPHKELAYNQVARRIISMCTAPITEYDLFENYMMSYGKLHYYDPMQKRNLRMVITGLVEDGYLSHNNGTYECPLDLHEYVERYADFDLSIDELNQQLADLPTVIQDISCSTSTSCKCTSTSTSSAVSSQLSSIGQLKVSPKQAMSVKQVL